MLIQHLCQFRVVLVNWFSLWARLFPCSCMLGNLYWIPDTVNFTSIGAKYFLISINILELYFGGSYLKIVLSFWVFLLRCCTTWAVFKTNLDITKTRAFLVQLTLKQHRFELWGSLIHGLFFNSKHYSSIIQFTVGWIGGWC